MTHSGLHSGLKHMPDARQSSGPREVALEANWQSSAGAESEC